MLLSDYTRRGIFDGFGIRLPTICVRPGKPNKAASGFFSGIIRERSAGQEAILPVSDGVRHWHASPRGSGRLPAARRDDRRSTPRRPAQPDDAGVAVTVAEQIEALRRVAGDAVAARIRHQPDPVIERIVAGWPRGFDPRRALELGFTAERTSRTIIRAHIEDELGGRIAA